ncbi:heterochromatin protein 1-like isoform X2 [Acyrthosiphon pisum]|uniref:Chromo domain-containing protein n=1 Tax=Acyrthosiphon pisum TaxID=7029 RepID=A0A8R2B6U8_ACYPI|nr:heterochromatin protein 1-like isoform X3 [Acyrthosiphon pisum]XP_008184083.1 heterochromatin protein 1-like isoform X1 [Acyrthosiphon pisum]XP_008184084.1 heterochromatin protein 1-like isoform X2 [Acyrthosiphon pisum]|eukprot:XP_003245219.1 PREDICTED: heterochromatin protein 1-like isoform X3 [Acyrthosiphon pisum]
MCKTSPKMPEVDQSVIPTLFYPQLTVKIIIPSRPSDSEHPIHDFSDDLVPETIAHMKVINGTYHYLVKWKDVEQLSYVPSSYANENIPQMVITFQEKHLRVVDVSR